MRHRFTYKQLEISGRQSYRKPYIIGKSFITYSFIYYLTTIINERVDIYLTLRY